MVNKKHFGHWTQHPEGVYPTLTSDSDTGLLGGVVYVVVSWPCSLGSSKCASLRQSNEIVSCFPSTSSLNYFSDGSSTLLGPSYGACNVFQLASWRTKTWVQVDKSECTYTFLGACWRTRVACSRISDLSYDISGWFCCRVTSCVIEKLAWST